MFREKKEPEETTYLPPKEPVKETEPVEITTPEIDYSQEYFGVKEIVKEDKMVKMQVGEIDKYLKELTKEKGYETNHKNWQEQLDIIEKQIGSSKLDTYKRLRKLADYIKVIRKYNKIKELKEKYVIFKNDIQRPEAKPSL